MINVKNKKCHPRDADGIITAKGISFLLLIPYAGITRIKLRVSGFSLLSADFLSTPVFYFQNQHNDNAKVIDCQQTADKKYSVPR